ncbi:MAG: carbohydrate kinase family protein [Oscillospiraceae bacterium]|nr:carbohydrate kinase family protein [Oscillospiraceae bacterium]
MSAAPETRRGIALAGNILADFVKTVDHYPAVGTLADIAAVTRAVGGCVPNVALDLARIDGTLPLSAFGRVGDDETGRYLIGRLRESGVDTAGIRISPSAPTSFSDVISLPGGERTFFHARGANAEFSPEDVDAAALDCRILHVGYLLLLDEFDREDPVFGTRMARFLRDVTARGVKTSLDAVSDSTGDYPAKVLPALPFCHYFIVNEIEACAAAGIEPRPGGALDVPAVRRAMEKLAGAGVRERVVVHAREAGFCLNCETGAFTAVPSLTVPAGEIRGSVGAGDAFCAGCLYTLYRGRPDREVLEFASAAAACSLFAENSVDGMRDKRGIEAVMRSYGRGPSEAKGGCG